MPAWAVMLVLAAAGLAAGRHGAEALRVRRHAVRVPGLHPDLEGVRLAHLSDLHGRTRTRWGADLAGLVRMLAPDAVLVTGDLVSRLRQLPPVLGLLRRFGPPLGTFMVTGNNERRLNPATLARLLREVTEAGVTVLDGRTVTLARGDGRLRLAGAPGSTRGPGLPPVVSRDPGEALVLLAHSPDVAPLAARLGVDLVLAGHTHGGQICLPGLGPLITRTRLGRRRARGLWRFDGTRVLVSAGVGTSYLPLRAFCPPEIGLVTLHSSEEGDGG